MQRFFVSPQELQDEEIALPPEVLHHLGTVLRRGEGEEILLLDGTGLICRCRIVSLGRKGGSARVIRRWVEEESVFPLTLLQGLPKGDKFDLVLQKGTELGVSAFVPVLCGRSIPSVPADRKDHRMARWQKIVCEAARQCRRSRLPLTAPPTSLRAALADRSEELRLLVWEEESRPLADSLPATPPRSAVILVGPEGGITPDEAEEARHAGFLPVGLGPRILRSETAGLAVASILQHLYGDLGGRHGRAPLEKTASREESS